MRDLGEVVEHIHERSEIEIAEGPGSRTKGAAN
jgi:hypothetical protein